MAATTVSEELEIRRGGGGRGGSGSGGPGFGGDGGDQAERSGAVPQRAYITGMTVGLAGILMFFMALTSAYIVRKGISLDWQTFTLPKILWLNTLVLLASSVTIERARRELNQSNLENFRYWWALTTVLGLLFLGGQFLAWRQLAAAGVYLVSNPSSSFFYVLTAAHGMHLLGGIVALLFVGWRNFRRAHIERSTATEVTAIYWHFMDGLWVFLLLLLYLGR